MPTCSALRLFLTAALSLSLATAHAAACNWLGGSGSWHDAAKWSCAAVPTATDDVTISNLNSGTITVNSAAPAQSLTFNSFGTISGTGALNVSGLASFNALSTTTVTTNGSRLPTLSMSPADSVILTFTDPALTPDSLVTFNSTKPTGGNGAVLMNVGARNYGTINVTNGYLRIDAPITVTTALNWAGGSLNSLGNNHAITIANTATLAISNGSTANNALFTPLINNGTATWSGNQPIFGNNSAEWTNNGSFTVQVSSPLSGLDNGLVIGQSASKPFTNYGTLRFAHTGTVQFEWVPGVLNHGLIEANSGSVLFRWGSFEQYAGETRLNGGTLAGNPKCCSLDNQQIYLRGGKISGSGSIIGGIENDGGIVELNGALNVSNFYTQTAKGSLKVTVAGTTPGTHFGTMNVTQRAGVTSNGSVSLAGSLIIDHAPGYTPRSGDRFNVITSAGNAMGRTSGGGGNMSPAFAAFAVSNQVFVSEPAAAFAVQAKADAPKSLRNETNGYTLRLINMTPNTVNVSSVQAQIASLFVVQPGTTAGITTINPSIFANQPTTGQQTLSWSLSPVVAMQAGETRTLHFNTVVSGTAAIGSYPSKFTVTSSAVTTTLENVAPVDILPSSAISSTALGMTGGRQQVQNGVNHFMIPNGTQQTTAINLRIRITCPPEYEPCGNLRTVFLGQEFNGRYINVRQLALDPDQNAAAPSDRLKRAEQQKAGSNYGFWKGQIPGSGVLPGVPVKLYPDWDAHRPCIAFNGDGNGLYPVGCVGPGEPLGTPQLYDPSGIITDAVTSQPIIGATVTLMRLLPGLPDVIGPQAQTRQCRTIDTRPGGIGGVWTGSTADTGSFEMPGFSPPQISPNVNPQVTGSDGRYGWDVVTGCWYVKVSAPGYAPKISALVGVPPAVTDLHVALQPAAACHLDLDGDGVVRPHTDALLLARYLANTAPNVDLTANAKNPTSAVAAATMQAAVEAMRDGLAVDVDGDGAANSKDALIIMRALLGFRDATLTQGLTFNSSSRQSGADLRIWMVTNCGLVLP